VSLQTGWHGVELRHLAALQAVARERSFSAAAASLGYTQSAISGQIVALERVIGARLVDRLRGSRLVELTEEGEVLLSHAAAIAARLEAAQADIAMLRAGSRQMLRVGTFETVSRSMVADVLQRLASEHPSLDVSLRESNEPDGLLDQLERGRLDLAFALLPMRDGPFEATAIYRDEHDRIAPHMVALAWHRDRPPSVQARRFVELAAATSAASVGRPLLRAM
jgi:DNA-binding transcriptional LysR family regulator